MKNYLYNILQVNVIYCYIVSRNPTYSVIASLTLRGGENGQRVSVDDAMLKLSE